MSRAAVALLAVTALLPAAGCKCSSSEPEPSPAAAAAPVPASASQPQEAPASYVGSERCGGCHAAQLGSWKTSQHRAAMQAATPGTVLGDFSGSAAVPAQERTRFHHEGERYSVDTLGKSYEVKYTFGVQPLQQYLLDVGSGRLQALTVAFDTRASRWYQLQPHEPTRPGDELHWTSAAYNWNSGCADCHSTHLQKNYDRASDSYKTAFSEISVGCEACHGPGSRHLEQATHGNFAGDRGLLRSFATPAQRHWDFVAGRPIAVLAAGSALPPTSARPAGNELEACAACHAHRADLGGDSLTFDDRYRLDLLDDDLYFPDGQQKEESFELGSFLQSKMYAAGVMCSDCHEPHAGSLRRHGNALCAGCHDAQHYDAPSHHLHTTGTAQSQCVTCHMPTHTFMEIDARREHRFSVPRPDLTLTLGVPNPCTDGCHAEKRRGAEPGQAAARWAADAIREHFGLEREPSFGPALAAGRALAENGRKDLLSVAQNERFPAIARATALVALRNYPELPLSQVLPLAHDASQLLRRAFAELMGTRHPDERRQTLVPLLSDRVRAVRLEAARHLCDVASLSPGEQATLAPVLEDLRGSLEHNADRAGALLELANLALARAARPGSADAEAEALFEQAERLEPSLAVVYLNHADFLRERRRDADAVSLLERGLKKCHDRAPLEHALGLAEVRRGNKTAGLPHLRRAFELAPGASQLGYVYAVALFDTGRVKDAIVVLQKLHRAAPADLETMQLLARYLRESGDNIAATELERELSRMRNAAH